MKQELSTCMVQKYNIHVSFKLIIANYGSCTVILKTLSIHISIMILISSYVPKALTLIPESVQIINYAIVQ